MDARDRLRRYIEQRRELGESEFVLDALPVEDVLRMLGAPAAAKEAKAAPRATPSRVAEARHDEARLDEARHDDARLDESNPRAEALSREPADQLAPGDSASTASPEVAPPIPEVRFDATRSTDWRSALSAPGTDRETRSEPAASAASAASAAPSVGATNWPAWLAALEITPGLNVGSGQDALFRGAIGELPSLEAVAGAIRGCRACSLYSSATNPVPGEGNPDADFVCVGEAPGASEDESGRPFVGAAGQLLTKILAAIHFAREEVFICNVLKHRPPGNRNPLPDEVRACSPYLVRQLELLRPRVILALGTFAAQTLLETTQSIGKLRGQVHRYHGIPLVVTYHPAALLRNESWKRPTWEDVKLARRILDASRAANPPA